MKKTGWVLLFIFLPLLSTAWEKGIYVTQSTLENPEKIRYLISNAKKVGLTTFVIDFDYFNSRYPKHIQWVKDAGIKYVARIVVFPYGGTREQVQSKAYWEKKYRLVDGALKAGADEIQLDYIRYNSKGGASEQKVREVLKVIQFFKQRISSHGKPMQIAVFGETSYIPSLHIGQDVRVFVNNFDVLNPMVYPSHFKPFDWHTSHPYETIFKALTTLRKKMGGELPFKLVPYIEVSNYHNPKMSGAERIPYIRKQIKAAKDAGAQGWYAWSPNNYYDYLFQALKE